MARNSYFPGWLRDSDEFRALSLSELRYLILAWGFANKKGKLYPFSKTIRRNKALCKTSLGSAKIKLARKGLLCFARGVEGRTSHTVWLALDKVEDFAVDTSGPEFEEYRQAIGTASGRRRKPTNNIGWFKKGGNPRQADNSGRGPTDTPGSGPTDDVGRGFEFFSAPSRRENQGDPPPQQGREQGPEQERMRSTALWAAETQVEKSTPTALTTADLEEETASPGKQSPLAVAGSATATGGRAPRGPGPAQQLLAHHCQNFLRKTGSTYATNPAKDLSLAKRLLEHAPLERLKEINNDYFSFKDDFVIREGFTFGVFFTKFHAINMRLIRYERTRGGFPPAGTRTLIQTTETEKIYQVSTGSSWRIVHEPRNPPPSNKPDAWPYPEDRGVDDDS